MFMCIYFVCLNVENTLSAAQPFILKEPPKPRHKKRKKEIYGLKKRGGRNALG